MGVRKAVATKTRTRKVALLFVAALGLALPHALCSAIATICGCPEDLGLGLSIVQADPEKFFLLGKVAVLPEHVLLPSAAVLHSLLSLPAPELFEVVAFEGLRPTGKDHDTEQQRCGPNQRMIRHVC